jgi:hypothetical protein
MISMSSRPSVKWDSADSARGDYDRRSSRQRNAGQIGSRPTPQGDRQKFVIGIALLGIDLITVFRPADLRGS